MKPTLHNGIRVFFFLDFTKHVEGLVRDTFPLKIFQRYFLRGQDREVHDRTGNYGVGTHLCISLFCPHKKAALKYFKEELS